MEMATAIFVFPSAFMEMATAMSGDAPAF
jgi:hypothetical protein